MLSYQPLAKYISTYTESSDLESNMENNTKENVS